MVCAARRVWRSGCGKRACEPSGHLFLMRPGRTLAPLGTGTWVPFNLPVPLSPGLSVPNVHGALAPLAIPSAAAAAAAGRIAIPGLAGAGNSVLLVSNLSPEVRALPSRPSLLEAQVGNRPQVSEQVAGSPGPLGAPPEYAAFCLFDILIYVSNSITFRAEVAFGAWCGLSMKPRKPWSG